MKRITKIIVAMLLMVTLCCLCIAFVGCDKEDTWEIVYFDDNWEQLGNYGLKNNSPSHDWGTHDLIYDGEIKGFNAKAYKNGKEIYKFDYKNPQCYRDKILKISICKRPENFVYLECNSINDMPKEKGEYYIQIMFYDAFKNDTLTKFDYCTEELKFYIR